MVNEDKLRSWLARSAEDIHVGTPDLKEMMGARRWRTSPRIRFAFIGVSVATVVACSIVAIQILGTSRHDGPVPPVDTPSAQPKIAIPAVSGLPAERATDTLTRAGLKVRLVVDQPNPGDCLVQAVGTEPSTDSDVLAGSVVILHVIPVCKT